MSICSLVACIIGHKMSIKVKNVCLFLSVGKHSFLTFCESNPPPPSFFFLSFFLSFFLFWTLMVTCVLDLSFCQFCKQLFWLVLCGQTELRLLPLYLCACLPLPELWTSWCFFSVINNWMIGGQGSGGVTQFSINKDEQQ